MRIAYYPSHLKHTNPYFELYHEALARHGITVEAGDVNDAYLRQRGPALDAFHIQWCPESIWRLRGEATADRLRGIVGLVRFLRLNRALGLNLLWTVHDLEHHEGADWIDRLGYRVLAHYADLTMCHSEWCREQVLARFHIRPERLLHFPHGNYDGAYPSPRPASEVRAEWQIAPDRRLLLCFGFVRPYKGADLAIEALLQSGEPYELIIAGPPTDPPFIAQLRARAGDDPRIHFHVRTLDDQQIADLIHASDCALFPYRKITGSGALAAALTLGTGVVTSALPYFSETLAPEPLAGEQFPAGDAKGLAEALSRYFARSPAERGRAARRLADRYAWDTVVTPVVSWLDAHERR